MPDLLCRTLHSFLQLFHHFALHPHGPHNRRLAPFPFVRSRFLVLVLVLLLTHSHSLVPRISTLSSPQSSPTFSHHVHPAHCIMANRLAAPSLLPCSILAASSSLPHPRCPTLAALPSLHRPRSNFSPSHPHIVDSDQSPFAGAPISSSFGHSSRQFGATYRRSHAEIRPDARNPLQEMRGACDLARETINAVKETKIPPSVCPDSAQCLPSSSQGDFLGRNF